MKCKVTNGECQAGHGAERASSFKTAYQKRCVLFACHNPMPRTDGKNNLKRKDLTSPISMHNDTFIVLPRRTQSVPDKSQRHQKEDQTSPLPRSHRRLVESRVVPVRRGVGGSFFSILVGVQTLIRRHYRGIFSGMDRMWTERGKEELGHGCLEELFGRAWLKHSH